MSEPKDLLLIVEHLRRSNRRWKALALAACSALVLAVLATTVIAARVRVQAEKVQLERLRAEHALRLASAALANTPRAANSGPAK